MSAGAFMGEFYALRRSRAVSPASGAELRADSVDLSRLQLLLHRLVDEVHFFADHPEGAVLLHLPGDEAAMYVDVRELAGEVHCGVDAGRGARRVLVPGDLLDRAFLDGSRLGVEFLLPGAPGVERDGLLLHTREHRVRLSVLSAVPRGEIRMGLALDQIVLSRRRCPQELGARRSGGRTSRAPA